MVFFQREVTVILVVLAVSLDCRGQYVKITLKDSTERSCKLNGHSSKGLVVQGDGILAYDKILKAHFYSFDADAHGGTFKQLMDEGVVVTREDVNSNNEVQYANWVIREREAVFDRVFDMVGTADELRQKAQQFFPSRTFIKDTKLQDGELVGRIEKWKIDWKKHGGTAMNTAGGFKTGTWDGVFIVKFKDNKYRVIVYDLKCDAQDVSVYYGLGISSTDSNIVPWNEWVLRKDRLDFKSNGKTNALFLSNILQSEFTIKDIVKAKDDW